MESTTKRLCSILLLRILFLFFSLFCISFFSILFTRYYSLSHILMACCYHYRLLYMIVFLFVVYLFFLSFIVCEPILHNNIALLPIVCNYLRRFISYADASHSYLSVFIILSIRNSMILCFLLSPFSFLFL